MLNFLRKHEPDATPLLNSAIFDEHSFYRTFSTDLKRAVRTVLIESPYVTTRRATEIAPLINQARRRGVEISIFTRNSLHHDGILISEATRGIAILRKAGAKVIACDDMRHRKLAMIDGFILWEGSLNMLSQNGSKEIMRRITSRELCDQMIRFIGIN